VGAIDPDGTLHWDIIAMILAFGVSIYLNQSLTATSNTNDDAAAASQNSVNKITPILFSGMFLFFPLPAGVLLYILISNIFQTAQTFLLSREPLPESLQQLVDQERAAQPAKEKEKGKGKEQSDREASLPFEP
jgi:YidC/Oxa1 family membrane protein insertase